MRQFLSLLYIVTVTSYLYADDQSAWNTGKNFGAQVKTEYGTNIQNSLVAPLTQDKSFTTMDGSTSFNANMTCGESSRSFMTVTYSLGSPQNGVIPIVKIDEDLDGTKEYTFTSPYTASAVCSNGIAVCDGGNFSGGTCSYYSWSYNGSSLSFTTTPSNTMSGCKCINDTCGSIASMQKDSIVDSLASSVYGVISAYNAKYIISSTTVANGVAEWFGQRADSCSNYKGTVATTGTSTSIDASNQVIVQSNDSTSPYSALLGTSSNYSTNAAQTQSQVNTTTNASKNIHSNVNHKDGTTDFTTQDVSSGTSINGHVGIPLDNENDKYCQVKWLGTSNAVFTDNTERSTATTSGEQWQTETRLCVNGVCPYSPSKGESIKFDCGNINNFDEAASAFATLQELADDITCGSI